MVQCMNCNAVIVCLFIKQMLFCIAANMQRSQGNISDVIMF